MSRKFPVLSAKDVTRVLQRHGFGLVGQSGSHQKWRHANGRQVIVPVHGARPLPIGTLRSIVDGSGIDAEEFR